jgi:Xaa-Pro dipeptidase
MASTNPPSGEAGSIFLARQKRLAQALQVAGLEAMAINPGPSLTYLTGLHFHLMERPVVALFVPGDTPRLVLGELEIGKTRNLPYPLQATTYSDNPATWQKAFDQAMLAAEIDGQRVGVEPTRLRVLELRLLEAAAPRAKFISGEDCLAALRMHKDQAEVQAMKKAVEIAQQALQATLPAIRPGISERDLASELTLQLLRAGSQSEMPFAPIVASGPNSANPHSVPGERLLERGDLLVLDWGATYDGYISDLTRTLAIGEIGPELERVYAAVLEANAAGRAAARPGIPAGQVDVAARQAIEKAGYGQYFIHRTGHGIGMEGHEGPYIFAENNLILAPGMAFTVEPGIYLPGRGGVRIEDNVVITETGAESLSDWPREMTIIIP